MLPTQRATGVLDNTIFGNSQSPLPGPFDAAEQEQSLACGY